jgi:tripartite-type tricarboxylate transporter receptor subunit TctC
MLKKWMICSLVIVFAMVAIAGCGQSKDVAAKYPEKEIRVIIPYKAGGQSDLTARKLAEIIQKKNLLSQPLVVVSIPGAATIDALKTVQTSKPDGYTLLLHHSAFLTMKALGQIPMSYKDFDMVSQVAEVPLVFVAKKDAPWKNAREILDAAKKEPGKISIGIPGVGGLNHLVTLYFTNKTQSEQMFKLVPFEGGAEALTAQLGGHIDLRASTAGDTARYIRSGELKAILAMDTKDIEGIPSVGNLKDFNITKGLVQRNGIFTTKNTPKPIKDKLAAAFKQAVESDEFKEFCKAQGCVPQFLNAEDYAKIFEEDNKIIEDIAKTIVKK